MQARKRARREDTEESPIPITVRQLEALVRISEALARMELLGDATQEHVEMAFKIFEASTLNAMNAGLIVPAGQEDQQVGLRLGSSIGMGLGPRGKCEDPEGQYGSQHDGGSQERCS